MKRPNDQDDYDSSSGGESQTMLEGFLRRHPRLPSVVGTIVILVIIVVMIIAVFLSPSH